MSHFYASIPVSARKTIATACGTKSSGLVTTTASFDGAIEVQLHHDKSTGKDHFEIRQVPHLGAGISNLIAEGILGE